MNDKWEKLKGRIYRFAALNFELAPSLILSADIEKRRQIGTSLAVVHTATSGASVTRCNQSTANPVYALL